MEPVSISADRVRRQYEIFAYPNYPLMARMSWQESWTGASAMAQSLARYLGHSTARPRLVLVGGCGDTLPWILDKWESPEVAFSCVDFSQTNIKRARRRMWRSGRPVQWVVSDLSSYLHESRQAGFDHVDLYGVLHHDSRPEVILQQVFSKMSPGGTCRFMVYNAEARSWIHQIQSLLRLLGLTSQSQKQVTLARKFVGQLRLLVPRLEDYLRGTDLVAHDTRFVDTFLHAHECRRPLASWLQWLSTAGFRILGLFDRYGELDDLPNPLWQMPSVDELTVRSLDGRFENNFELFLQKPDSRPSASAATVDGLKRVSLPPRAAFDWRETRFLTRAQRRSYWSDPVVSGIPPDRSTCLRRLARMGVVFAKSDQDRQQLAEPLESFMEAPLRPHGFPEGDVTEWVDKWLQDLELSRGKSAQRRGAILQRIRRLSGS